ncbi:MAG: hypothetical protein JWQ48_1932 [Conexibacter sp.]|nr:hypothetical protein [Conexibacter sp.]
MGPAHPVYLEDAMPESHSAPQDKPRRRRLRRVVIDAAPHLVTSEDRQREALEDRQRKTLQHVRLSKGYAEDLDPHAHDQATFRLINLRRELDGLPGAEYVIPKLDDWKHWVKMSDWDSRNQLLETLTTKLRRREATEAEIQLLVILCRPAWNGVLRSLRRSESVDLDVGADGVRLREEARRVNELDHAELDQVVQHGLLTALSNCPRPFPRRFFPWLRCTLAHRALEHVRGAVLENTDALPHDLEIAEVLDNVLADNVSRGFAAYTPASPARDAWLRTLDLASIFALADEYAPYARMRSACARAVDRLPSRQRSVIEGHYFEAMTQQQIARLQGLADSSVRNAHSHALRNLRRDDELFDVLETIGRVRDRQRRLRLDDQERDAA